MQTIRFLGSWNSIRHFEVDHGVLYSVQGLLSGCSASWGGSRWRKKKPGEMWNWKIDKNWCPQIRLEEWDSFSRILRKRMDFRSWSAGTRPSGARMNIKNDLKRNLALVLPSVAFSLPHLFCFDFLWGDPKTNAKNLKSVKFLMYNYNQWRSQLHWT